MRLVPDEKFASGSPTHNVPNGRRAGMMGEFRRTCLPEKPPKADVCEKFRQSIWRLHGSDCSEVAGELNENRVRAAVVSGYRFVFRFSVLPWCDKSAAGNSPHSCPQM